MRLLVEAKDGLPRCRLAKMLRSRVNVRIRKTLARVMADTARASTSDNVGESILVGGSFELWLHS